MVKYVLVALSVFLSLTLFGCATLTGKAKPVELTSVTKVGNEDGSESRNSFQTGVQATFDNGHSAQIDYRWRDSENEDSVFFTYSFPIWRAKENGAWGEGDWINPIDLTTLREWTQK